MSDKVLDKAYFISFCIEQYKNAKGLSGAEAMHELDRYGVLDYMEEYFEVLHTQSCQWLLDDIDDFIRIRKEKNDDTVPRQSGNSGKA